MITYLLAAVEHCFLFASLAGVLVYLLAAVIRFLLFRSR
jgi:hypothetical protein